MFKRTAFKVAAFLLTFVLLSSSVSAFDMNGADYSSDIFFIGIITDVDLSPATAKEVEKLEDLINGDELVGYDDWYSFFGVDATNVRQVVSGMYRVTLKNQLKQYYLPQLDFLTVTVGKALSYIEPNALLRIPEDPVPTLETVYIPDEVLYFTKPQSQADALLSSLLGEAEGSLYGFEIAEVTSIARYAHDSDDGTALALYSVKLKNAAETASLINVLNGEELADSRNQNLHTLLGYSAVQANYVSSAEEDFDSPSGGSKLELTDSAAALNRFTLGKHFRGFEVYSTVGAIKSLFKYNVEIKDKNGEVMADTALVGTGAVISCGYESCIAVLAGDVNGDAMVSSIDYLSLAASVKGGTALGSAYSAAADLNGDGVNTATDCILIKSMLQN